MVSIWYSVHLMKIQINGSPVRDGFHFIFSRENQICMSKAESFSFLIHFLFSTSTDFHFTLSLIFRVYFRSKFTLSKPIFCFFSQTFHYQTDQCCLFLLCLPFLWIFKQRGKKLKQTKWILCLNKFRQRPCEVINAILVRVHFTNIAMSTEKNYEISSL